MRNFSDFKLDSLQRIGADRPIPLPELLICHHLLGMVIFPTRELHRRPVRRGLGFPLPLRKFQHRGREMGRHRLLAKALRSLPLSLPTVQLDRHNLPDLLFLRGPRLPFASRLRRAAHRARECLPATGDGRLGARPRLRRPQRLGRLQQPGRRSLLGDGRAERDVSVL